MFKTIGKCDFMDEFRKFDGRYDQFGGYDGLSALFDYLESYESDPGGNVELDIIALCCDFTYYDSLEDLQAEYDKIESMEELEDHTIVIKVENSNAFIIQNF